MKVHKKNEKVVYIGLITETLCSRMVVKSQAAGSDFIFDAIKPGHKCKQCAKKRRLADKN